MKLRSQCAICVVVSVGFFAACGDDDSPPPSSTGGAPGATGGAKTTGGAAATGGAKATGGAAATGGAGGGPGTGGTTASGGTSASGGAASGGTSASGGASSGGASSGGASSGGASSGGASSGGASSGGASSGGASSGGASSGGASSGGASSGGASSGGAASGGTDSGAPDSGGPDGGDASVDPPPNTVFINEVESNNGAPDDWVELYNTGSTAVDISGWIIRDNDDTNGYTFPSGTMVPATGFLVIDRVNVGQPGGIDFGLGAVDSVRLFDGTTLVDTYAWTAHAASGTYRRCPDGTGAFAAGASTKNATNNCQ